MNDEVSHRVFSMENDGVSTGLWQFRVVLSTTNTKYVRRIRNGVERQQGTRVV